MNNFSNLSPADFEDLCRDIASKEYQIRFEAFGPGADDGFDGRHSIGDDTTVLQAKHYSGSKFEQLLRSIKQEKAKLAFKNCKKYLLFTSLSMTPKRKELIFQLLEEGMQDPSAIWGQQDIESALRRHPDILKSHIKLWLSSTGMLESILHSGVAAYSGITRREIEDDLKVYAKNQSFDEAIQKLDSEHVLIISGIAGVGKTTLARMLAYAYICEGWKFTSITSLDQGFNSVASDERELFFFDDFLGLAELDRASLLRSDNALSLFIRSMHRTTNKRFILTTRAHIFEEARRVSDRIDSQDVQIGKYLLDTGKYTRMVRSRILFNHICSATMLSEAHIRNLIETGALATIIDHKNYNPRVVSAVSSNLLNVVEPEEYPKLIIEALDNPEMIWRKPYESLSLQKKNLLISLYFMSQYGASLDKLEPVFLAINNAVSKKYFHPIDPMSFEKSLRELESGFITISNKVVRFVNPAVRDFLKLHLVDFNLLSVLASGALYSDWARELWRHGCGLENRGSFHRKDWAEAFLSFTALIEMEPVFRVDARGAPRTNDLCRTERQTLLMDWWDSSKNSVFIEKVFSLTISGEIPIYANDDADEIPELVWRIENEREEDVPRRQEIVSHLNNDLSGLLEDSISAEKLVRVVDRINEFYSGHVPELVFENLKSAVSSVFCNVEEFLQDASYSSDVTEHIEYLEQLERSTGIYGLGTLSKCKDRLRELEATETEEEGTSPSVGSHPWKDASISDTEINSLFGTLLR